MASTESVPSDAERIKTTRLCCLMVATCRHAQARSALGRTVFPLLLLALTLTKTLKGVHANLMPCEVAAGSLPSVVLSQARSRREDLQQAHQKCFELSADKICWDLANLARWLRPFCVGCAKKPMWVPHKPRCQLGRVGIELCVLLGDCLQAITETL